MIISKEVLISFQDDIEFYNLDDLFEINDLEFIDKNYEGFQREDCLFWIDQKIIRLSSFNKSKGVILISKESYKRSYKLKSINFSLIVARNPKQIFLTIEEFLLQNDIVPAIHPLATVHLNAKIGNNVYIGPGCVIDQCEIGNNCIIHSNCSIGKGVKIGNNSIVHSGANLGFNVFSFKQNTVGTWIKHQQIAGVSIGKHVTIGSNTCINNGFVIDTIISDKVFIDSLCQVQGSVYIGESTIVAASTFIASNVTIGARCWISPNVSIKENISIVDDVFVGIGSVVLRNIKKPCRVFGVPAKLIIL